MGKAYANKKKKHLKPLFDFYPTPKSLVWVARDKILQEFDKSKVIFEPCSGSGAIANELKKDFEVIENDIINGFDYLTKVFNYSQIITNPPFNLWDEFLIKAKTEADKIMFIGRLNYLSTHSRLKKGLWQNLKSIYIFDRYVDYRTPDRNDGLFNVGAMATGWFLWEKEYDKKPTIDFLSVQNYALLGNFKSDVVVS